MKKYLLGLSALALAVGFSSFTAIKAHAKSKFTDFYFAYPTTAPQTQAGYETNTNYVVSTQTAFNACSGNQVHECNVDVNSEVNIGGTEFPDFTGMSFTSQGFPHSGATFNGNATKN